ncbi:hypothetical protein GA0074695_4576 [Micromonospora viridifaciens]|uniref:Uncharacterized protein n=2 Tax=Micromonospora viridifaciens TaxID=1881 RepID=A0A1C4YQP4_MICVI|nr:hypothetical protein GA0074695_4576 [Micromonospora viridifaciens]
MPGGRCRGHRPPAHGYAGVAMNTSEPSGERGAEKLNWIDRRREKIRAEIERNRRGEYKVPTWVLAAALILIVGAWLALIFLAG